MDERDDERERRAGQLDVFAYATRELAPLYVPVMEAVVEAGERLVLHVRPAEVASATDLPVGEVARALKTLRDLGCLIERHDRFTQPKTLEEMAREMVMYSATEAGRMAHEAVRLVQAVGLVSPGILRASSLQPLCDHLAALALLGEPATLDGPKVAAEIIVLHELCAGLHRGSQGYMQALDLRVEDVAEDDSFVGFKHAVIAYLSDFLVALDEYQPRIEQHLAALMGRAAALVEAAGRTDAGPDVDIAGQTAEFEGRLFVVDRWFRGSVGTLATVEELRRRMSAAIGVLLDALRRNRDLRDRRVSRRADLLTCARWVASAADADEAAGLMAVLFGLYPARHPNLAAPAVDGRGMRFEDAPPVPVSPVLWATGRRNAQGRSGRRADYTQVKAAARRRRAEEEGALAKAATRFHGRHVRLSEIAAEGPLDEHELAILLGALDGATRGRARLDQPAVVDCILGLVSVVVFDAIGTVTVRTAEGVLEAPDWEMRFSGRAAAGRPAQDRDVAG